MFGKHYVSCGFALTLVAAAALLLLAACEREETSQQPRQRALLIGVNDYDILPPERDLLGPANDVRLFRDVFKERGLEDDDIFILADGVRGADAPTRANILSAWDRLKNDSQPGDSLFFYFAGHGSQQPSNDETESDGLEEIILPQDIGRWDGSAGHVINAITDNEIGRFIDDYSSSGADVWAVFDACHSATLTRAMAVPEGRLRYVNPASDLGTPGTGSATAVLTANEFPLPQVSATRGAVTAFFAAASREPTPELRLPAGHPERQYHGLFSYTLAKLIRSATHASYRDLANQLLLDYSSQNRRAPTPSFSGSLDRPLFLDDSRPERSWIAELDESAGGYRIRAGLLHGVNSGARLALHATDNSSRQLIVEVDSVGLQASHGTVIGVPTTLPMNAAATLYQPAVEFTLKICQPDDSRLLEIATTIVAESTRLAMASDDACNIRLLPDSGFIWLADMSASAVAGIELAKQVPRVDLNDPDGLGEELERIATARALSIAAATMSGTLDGFALSVTAQGGEGTARQLVSGNIALLNTGEKLTIEMRNSAEYPVDVTILFIDGHYQIASIWPAIEQSNRLRPGQSASWVGSVDTSVTSGREQLVAITTRASTNTVPMDFSFLAGRQIPSVRRGSVPVFDFLLEAGTAGGRTRGVPAEIGENTRIQVISWIAQ